jgi:prepilin-type N-terminal cleavage/methylation domain-containing protein
MKKGFTIIELLVASLLLGMLVSVLTMLFNQSSIAWRTGVATIVDMDVIRDEIASIREEADNLILAPETSKKMFMFVSPWDESGNLRRRAVNVGEMGGDNAQLYSQSSMFLFSQASYLRGNSVNADDLGLINCGGSDSARKSYGYTVGVTSAGPDREFGTYDDITSWPEEF